MRSGEQLAKGATFDSSKSSSQYSASAASLFADRYFVNEVIARLRTHGFAVVCSNGCPAFEELASENVSGLGLWKSADIFDHGEGKSLRSELKFVLHILSGILSGNAELGMRRQSAIRNSRFLRFRLGDLSIRNSHLEFRDSLNHIRKRTFGLPKVPDAADDEKRHDGDGKGESRPVDIVLTP
jgi:hypothetical protein